MTKNIWSNVLVGKLPQTLRRDQVADEETKQNFKIDPESQTPTFARLWQNSKSRIWTWLKQYFFFR